MPKRAIILLLAAISLGLAVPACNKSTTPNPTPAPSVSFTPDPNVSSTIIKVTIQGSPTAKIPVDESTPSSMTNPRPGTTIVTHRTGSDGTTVFKNLTPSATYCWVAVLGPPPTPPTSSTCAPWDVWQNNTITIGT